MQLSLERQTYLIGKHLRGLDRLNDLFRRGVIGVCDLVTIGFDRRRKGLAVPKHIGFRPDRSGTRPRLKQLARIVQCGNALIAQQDLVDHAKALGLGGRDRPPHQHQFQRDRRSHQTGQALRGPTRRRQAHGHLRQAHVGFVRRRAVMPRQQQVTPRPKRGAVAANHNRF